MWHDFLNIITLMLKNKKATTWSSPSMCHGECKQMLLKAAWYDHKNKGCSQIKLGKRIREKSIDLNSNFSNFGSLTNDVSHSSGAHSTVSKRLCIRSVSNIDTNDDCMSKFSKSGHHIDPKNPYEDHLYPSSSSFGTPYLFAPVTK